MVTLRKGRQKKEDGKTFVYDNRDRAIGACSAVIFT